MMTLKIGDKELKVKFAFEPTLKGRVISRMGKMGKEAATEEENMLKVEDMMLLLPDLLLVGLQKFHSDEYGYDYDTNEGKQEQLSKVFCLMDDYFDEDGADLMKLYNELQEEMLKNGFLASLFRNPEKLEAAEQMEAVKTDKRARTMEDA